VASCFNNLLFTAMAFATFWGTVFPIVSELFRDTKLMVGPPFYDQVNGPILLAIDHAHGYRSATGLAALIDRRCSTATCSGRRCRGGVDSALCMVLGQLLAILAARRPCSRSERLCWSTSEERKLAGRAPGRCILSRRSMLVRKNSRRYGGYIVHLAVAIMALGVIGSHFFQTERQFVMEPGDTGRDWRLHVTFRELDFRQTQRPRHRCGR
jgi:cytochrome c-type biogenesis protein CcmF